MPHRLRFLFDNLLSGVAHCRVLAARGEPFDFEFLSVNEALEAHVGVAGLTGRRASEVLTRRPPELYAMLQRVIDDGRAGRIALHSPVRQRWFEASAYRPEPGEFFLVLDDITDRKENEASLRFHQSVLEVTGRIAKVGGWSFDPASGDGFWTDEVARIHDLDPAAPTSRDLALTFYTDTSRPKIEQALADAVQYGTPYDLELEMITRAGNRKWIRTIGHTTLEDGRVVRVHGSFQDITDLKKTERLLAVQNEASRVLMEAGSVAEAVPLLLRTIAESEHWDAAVFYGVDEAATLLRFMDGWHAPSPDGERVIQAARALTFARGEGLPGEVWASGVADLRLFADLQPSERHPRVQVLMGFGYRSLLACPVQAPDRTIGVSLFLSTEVKPVDDVLLQTSAAIGRQFGLFVERKRAEVERSASEARHRMLVERASDGIFVVLPDGRYEDVNARYAEMIGRPRHEFIGQPAGFELATGDRARIAEESDALRQRGTSVSDRTLERPDGSMVEFEVSASLLPNGRVMGIVRDVTERKKIEAAAQRRLELEAQLSKLAAAAPGAIYSFRLRGDGVPCFPYASQQVQELTGFTPEELATDARAALSRMPAEDLEAFQGSIEESARTMSIWSMSFRHEHPTKGLRRLDARSMPVRDADGVVWHGFMMDITERYELEDRFRQAQKMEAIGQLASGVAHDFNNLLTVIQGNASLLQDEADVRHESVHEIVQAAERAATLTRQLLLFSRKQEMCAVELDLNAVVADVTTLLRRVVGEDIVIATELSRRPVIVRADAGMLEQVLLNLAVNSRDAMPDGGCLTIVTSLTTPDQDGTPWAQLRVSDTGHGIPAHALPRIFEPFFTTKDIGKGTGLGLATVYAIVKQHGGSVDAHSEPDKGTTFEIVLPTTGDEATPATSHLDSDLGVPGGTERILVVEDEPSVRMLVSYLLGMNGYQVITAESGRAAMKLFEQEADRIDLLLTDMVMPDGVTGRELAEQLVALKPSLRVLYTSGYSPDVASNGLSLVRGRNFIPKPYLPRELASTVRAALDQ